MQRWPRLARFSDHRRTAKEDPAPAAAPQLVGERSARGESLNSGCRTQQRVSRLLKTLKSGWQKNKGMRISRTKADVGAWRITR
jgi:hypothetical protein